jgi:hypothetical protein
MPKPVSGSVPKIDIVVESGEDADIPNEGDDDVNASRARIERENPPLDRRLKELDQFANGKRKKK